MNKKQLTILLTLAAVQFTHILDSMVMMPMAPALQKSLTINTQQFGFLVGSYGISAFISAIAATFWVDKLDRKKALLILYLGFLIGTAACAFAPNYGFLIGARIFAGMFGGVAGAVILSIVGDVIPLEKRAQGMGILMSGFALASVGGVPLGIYLSEIFSWHAPFYFIVGVGFFVVFAIIFLIPPITSHIEKARAAKPMDLYKNIFSDFNQVRALLLSMCMVYAHFAIIPFMTPFYTFNLGMDMKTEIIWLYVVGGVASTFTSPLFGKLADKFGRFKVYTTLSILALIPVYMIPHFEAPMNLAYFLCITTMFFVFSGGRMIPSSAMVTSAVVPQFRGGFMSLNSAMQQLSIGISTIIGGLIIHNEPKQPLHNFEIVGYIGIAFTFIAIWVASGVKPVQLKK